MGKLTAKQCENTKPTNKDILLGDGDCLSLRIRPNGTKSWEIDYTFEGNRRKRTIGTYSNKASTIDNITELLHLGQLTLSQARIIAGAWKQKRRAKHDPVLEWDEQIEQEQIEKIKKQEALESEKNKPTLDDVINQFLEKIIKGKKSASNIKYKLKRLSELLGNKKIHHITRDDILSALDTISHGKKPENPSKQMAGEVLITTKRLWKFAKTRGIVKELPFDDIKRNDIDASPRKRSTTLYLNELKILWKNINDKEVFKADPVTVAALRMIILTGQRESEVCGARWSEFYLEEKLWKIPADRTKTKNTHLVPLSSAAIDTLNSLKNLTGSSDFVFESPLKKGQPIYGRTTWNALNTLFKKDSLVGITKCNVHDLRRTLITRLPDLGFEAFIGHKIANHTLQGVFQHYNHNSYFDKQKEALKSWCDMLETPDETIK